LAENNIGVALITHDVCTQYILFYGRIAIKQVRSSEKSQCVHHFIAMSYDYMVCNVSDNNLCVQPLCIVATKQMF